MSSRILWRRAIYQTIINRYKSMLSQNSKSDFHNWRLGYNLFCNQNYLEAIFYLQNLSSKYSSDINYVSIRIEESQLHLITGRCCLQLFFQTSQHYHLENAYKYYQLAIETLEINLYTMFKLPLILFEFGKILEYYGSLQSALATYNRILSSFPNSKCYFDGMYRSAILIRHMAEFSEESKEREDAYNKCIDIFQFLLEALPTSIDEVHILILYARTLERSTNAANRYRAPSIYQSLYNLLHPPHPHPLPTTTLTSIVPSLTPTSSASTTSLTNTLKPATGSSSSSGGGASQRFKTWLNDPMTWHQMSQQLQAAKEPLINRECHTIMLEKMELQRLQGLTRPGISLNLTPVVCMEIAYNNANFQNYEEAVKFAELAFQQDHFNAEIRHCLSKWSAIHRVELQKEEESVARLRRNWKLRCWKEDFRVKLKTQRIIAAETDIQSHQYDSNLRNELAYYARDKWRAKFLFENICAKRIQNSYHIAKLRWTWQSPLREKYLNIANAVCARYSQSPLDPLLRDEVKRVAAHSMCPQKHPIRDIVKQLRYEDKCINLIRSIFKAFLWRKGVRNAMMQRRLRRQRLLGSYALKIQCLVRRVQAKTQREVMRQRRLLRIAAAIKIQSYFRKHKAPLKMAVMKALRKHKQAQDNAKRLLRRALPLRYRMHIARGMRKVMIQKEAMTRQLLAVRMKPERVLARSRWARSISYAMSLILQQHNYVIQNMITFSIDLLKARKKQQLSQITAISVQMMAADPSTRYSPPGIKQNTLQFQKVLVQSQLLLTSSFTSTDCIMYAAVLRHPLCDLMQLVLFQVDASHVNFEFDFIPALGRCKALRSVRVLGGRWSAGCLRALMLQVQVENPRIREVALESIPTTREGGESIALGVGMVVADYFNYSAPGLMSLSLHGMGLQTKDLQMLATGLDVTRSLQSLCLSGNFIDNLGLMLLFRAITKNKRSSMDTLDLSWNLITDSEGLLDMLFSHIQQETTNITNPAKPLHIYLYCNPIINTASFEIRSVSLRVIPVESSHPLTWSAKSTSGSGVVAATPSSFPITSTTSSITTSSSSSHLQPRMNNARGNRSGGGGGGTPGSAKSRLRTFASVVREMERAEKVIPKALLPGGMSCMIKGLRRVRSRHQNHISMSMSGSGSGLTSTSSLVPGSTRGREEVLLRDLE